jgi:ergothioneine biosynthesis protein EgtB
MKTVLSVPPGVKDLAQRFTQVRQQTEKICRPLLPEDTVVQPIVDVSPPKWHLAHTSWFFETFILEKFVAGYQRFHPAYNYLFNSYYNSLGSRVMRDQRGTLSRPALSEVYAYRQYVDEQVLNFLEIKSDNIPEEVLNLLELGLQHEQQHQELLVTDIKFILSSSPLLPEYQPLMPANGTKPEVPETEYLEVPEGFYQMGYAGREFCFDNEQPAHRVWLPGFQVRNTLVTNREYLAFIQDGGYRDFRFWLGEGYERVQQENWEAPLYWVQPEDTWQRFTLHGLQDPDPDAPVTHISFYEAAAYANWAGKRLLTEPEWEAICRVYPPETADGNFLESGCLDTRPAQAGRNTCHQLLGDAWEWTNSAYLPYPGYEAAAGALGEYNGKFMINQMVLRGGSCATPASHIRTTYRNFFHPEKRWQFTGIRLASK